MDQKKQLIVDSGQLTHLIEAVQASYTRTMHKAQRHEEHNNCPRSPGTTARLATWQELLQYLQRRHRETHEEEFTPSYLELHNRICKDIVEHSKTTGKCSVCGTVLDDDV